MSEQPKTPPRPDRVGLNDWFRLARAVPAAFDVRKLVLAAVGLLLVQIGWSAIESIAPRPPSEPTRVLETRSLYGTPFRSAADFAEAIRRPSSGLTAPARALIDPMTGAFAIDGSRDRAPAEFLRLLWAIVVLGATGTAVARLAVVEAATGARPTTWDAIKTAFRGSASAIGATLLPLAVALALGLASAPFGFAARLFPETAAVLTVVPLVLGVATTVLLVATVATWPLAPAAVAMESERTVEVVSRTFGYVRRRPMAFAAGVLASWALGTLGLAAFEVFLSASIHLTVWGMGLAAYPALPGEAGGLVEWPASVMLGLACPAWTFAFFWSASARVYLLLRQDLDDAAASR